MCFLRSATSIRSVIKSRGSEEARASAASGDMVVAEEEVEVEFTGWGWRGGDWKSRRGVGVMWGEAPVNTAKCLFWDLVTLRSL